MTTKHILIVEDEIKIASLLEDYLRSSQYQSSTLNEGDGVVDWVMQKTPDLILLDLMLPGKNGMDICREIRQFSNVPIIMITARVEEIDRILGLEIGADDYICKPFSPREVVARINVIFRRLNVMSTTSKQQNDAFLELDEDKYEAHYKHIKLDLTPVEFRLIHTLQATPGKVFSRDQLMSLLYKDNRIVTDRTIDSHIKNLRKKLYNAGCENDIIHSVYGVGYKYEPIANDNRVDIGIKK